MTKRNKNKKVKKFLPLVAGVTLLFGSTAALYSMKRAENDNEIERISYAQYTELLNNGDIDKIYYNENKEYMTIALFNADTRELTEKEREKYSYDNTNLRSVLYPDNDEFRKELLEKGVIVLRQSNTLAFLPQFIDTFVYLAIFGGMLVVLSRNSPLSANGFARVAAPNEIEVKFDDVIGHDEIKGDLQLLVKQLKSGVKAKDLSHGVLFEGGAGTGKTMLAKAIAHEAGVNFISVNSSNLVEMYVGLGAKRVRDAFKQARKAAPCVLFFDEIDAVGAKRGMQRSHRENDQTINALLTELDGFEEKGDILVIAATNLADNLDDALLRSGRFDRKVKVEAPQKWETRKELFDHYIEGKGDNSVDTETLAKQTVGFSGADIASICREARLIAFREDSKVITQDFLEEAIDKMVFKGNRSDDTQHKEDLEYVAYHEAGHAVMTYLSGRGISRISILGMTSGVGGAVFQSDNERFFETKEQIEQQIMIAYAGRASEAIRFGNNKISQGASNDITKATKLLVSYTSKLGFDSNIGLVDMDIMANGGILSSDRLSERVSELSEKFYKDTLEILKGNYCLVETLAEKLLEVKTLSGKEAEDILKHDQYKKQQAV